MIKEIQINNYKSFSDVDNKLKINHLVTPIVGKNESGKSNLINVLSNINKDHLMIGENEKDINKKKRRDGQISVSTIMIDAKGKRSDVKYRNKIFAYISGEISEIIKADAILLEKCQKLLEKISQNNYEYSRNSEDYEIKNCFYILEKNSDFIVTRRKEIFDKLKLTIEKNETDEVEELIDDIEYVENKLNEYYSMIPNYFRYDEKKLNDTYLCDSSFFEDYMTQDELFRIIWEIADVSVEDLKEACGINTTDAGVIFEQKKIINEKLKKHIGNKFNDFYKQSVLDLSFDVDNKNLRFIFSTDESNTVYSERSTGFKWFFCMFLTMQSQIENTKDLIILIDEPGVYLHVNAQKELLKWFYDYTDNTGNQIIYTTHSPYMLDKENMLSVRGIEKNEDGISRIINKIYSGSKRKTVSETFTPVTEVIGMKLSDNIGINTSGINLLVEGVSDYQYIVGMKDKLEIGDEINIIPCMGATSIMNLVPLFIGWGLEFKILLDGDNEGKGVKKKLKKYSNYIEGKIAFTTDFTVVNHRSTIEGLFSVRDLKMIEELGSNDKVLMSTYVRTQFLQKEISLEEETKTNFKSLFDWIVDKE